MTLADTPRPKGLRIFGYEAHLIVELPDGPHDILLQLDKSHEIIEDWRMPVRSALQEIEIEKRARARAKETAHETAQQPPRKHRLEPTAFSPEDCRTPTTPRHLDPA